MKKPWADKLIQIDPYVPGEQPSSSNIIKLNANENPYPPSPKIKEVLAEYAIDKLRFYPDSCASKLKKAIGAHFHLPEEQVFTGNGSDDVLALCFQAFFRSNKPILFPDITYSFYPVWCDLFQTPYKTIALDASFRIRKEDYYGDNGGIILPNPNAPTGISEGQTFIEDILNYNQDVIVIIDEAYVDFGGYSCVKLLNKYENLLIVHTFSKSRSLAGIRIGSAIGHPELIQTLEAVKNSYNSYVMDSLAIEIGSAAIADEAYFQETTKKVIATREATAKKLLALGFTVCPSHSNFLFVTHPAYKAKEIFDYLKTKGIYIRHFDKPRINNYLRITIGTDEDMVCLLDAMNSYIKNK